MTCNKVYFEMSYGVLPVHHLEHRWEKRFLFFKKPYAVAVPIWNEPLPPEKLKRIEETVIKAFSALDEKYKYAIDGRVGIHPRRTSVEVSLGMENDLKEEIIHDYFALAGAPDWFHNVSLDFLSKALQPFEKKLTGFSVVDYSQTA